MRMVVIQKLLWVWLTQVTVDRKKRCVNGGLIVELNFAKYTILRIAKIILHFGLL